MSLALDPALAARMNEQSRRPLIEIISRETVASIPFDGTALGSGDTNEQHPACILHSTGRICHVCGYGNPAGPYYLRYRYSDQQKTEFTVVDVPIEDLALDVSLTEMANGNIGVVYRHEQAIRYKTITVTGAVVASGLIGDIPSPYEWSGPFVVAMPGSTFLMVYSKKVSTQYYFYTRTSADFLSWAAESQISVAGLTSTSKKSNPFILRLAAGGALWLLFDYVDATNEYNQELTNIYYSESLDSGATWGTATQLTSYPYYKQVGKHPVAVQKTDTSMHLLFDQYMSCLHMGVDTLGWGTFDDTRSVHFDPTTRKLYAVDMSADEMAVVVVDVDNWEVLKRYDELSTPAIPTDKHYSPTDAGKHQGAGQYCPIVGYPVGLHGYYQSISIICGESDSIINIYPHADDPLCNVTGLAMPLGVQTYTFIMSTFVDEPNLRLWVHFEGFPIGYRTQHIVGYFSLTGGPPFAFTEVVNEIYTGDYSGGEHEFRYGQLKVYPGQDLLILNFSNISGPGAVKVYNISSGGLWKTFKQPVQAAFPYYGLIDCCLIGGTLYGCDVATLGGYETERYLWKIEVGAELIEAFPLSPIFGNVPHVWGVKAVDSSRITISASGGILLYNVSTNEYTLYDNASVPGLLDAGSYLKMAVYDLAADMVYTCAQAGISAFSAYGVLKQAQYYIGAFTTSWSFVDHGALVAGFKDYELTSLIDQSGDVLYGFWTRQTGTQYASRWDKEGIEFNLDDYLTVDTEIVYRRSIDGSPASLSFEVSHGHLFDVYNRNSLLNPYLKKGRRLSLRYGERISGVDYWQAMGYFLVTTQKIRYARGEYPRMQITAEDKSQFWPSLEVPATTYFQATYPEEIARDLLIAHADMVEEDIILGSWSGRSPLTHQWIESDLRTILEEILNRYGYYLRVDVNDDVRAKRITDDNPVDNSYPDRTKILNFTPDDSYASAVNRVVVTGTEQTEIEVLYPEERIAGLNGQVAYNTGSEDHIVWYSDDQSRKCRYPRLVVIKTSTSIGFQLSGEISEQLLNVDPNEKYCIINIDAPDLTDELIMSLAALVGSYFLPDMAVSFGFGSSTGWTIRIGSYLTALFTWTTMMILGATGSYDYEIWACPVGRVKRTVQGEANDAAHQALVRKIITRKIEDALCYSGAQCQAVAVQELKVASLQRNRCALEMVADLRNEDGDTIQIIHPYSNQSLNVFVTELERVMKKADARHDGHFIDRIEGWVVS